MVQLRSRDQFLVGNSRFRLEFHALSSRPVAQNHIVDMKTNFLETAKAPAPSMADQVASRITDEVIEEALEILTSKSEIADSRDGHEPEEALPCHDEEFSGSAREPIESVHTISEEPACAMISHAHSCGEAMDNVRLGGLPPTCDTELGDDVATTVVDAEDLSAETLTSLPVHSTHDHDPVMANGAAKQSLPVLSVFPSDTLSKNAAGQDSEHHHIVTNVGIDPQESNVGHADHLLYRADPSLETESQASADETVVVNTARSKAPYTHSPRPMAMSSGMMRSQVSALPALNQALEYSTTGKAEIPPSYESQTSSATDGLKILFGSASKIDSSGSAMAFLKSMGVKKVTSVTACDAFCVGSGKELKRTSNLVMAVASGKRVITDKWVIDSKKKGRLLDTTIYVAKDPPRERQWGISLAEAVERGRQGIKPLAGQNIFVSSYVKEKLGTGFKELKELALFAGAQTVQATMSSNKLNVAKAIVISAEDDPEISVLLEKGWKCFTKEIITLSILRGEIDLGSEEFGITAQRGNSSSQKTRKRKR